MNVIHIFAVFLFSIFLIAGCSAQKSPETVEDADPFGAMPLPVKFNCGPEERYKFDVSISSEEDFIDFLKQNRFSDWVSLDSFRDDEEEVDWDSALYEVSVDKADSRTVYSLTYVPFDCSEFVVKMTDDGHVSVYGCCGK